jgi:ribonuclease R
MSQDPFQEREAEKYANPIPSREFILDHLTKREKPASRDELAIELNIEGEEQQEALRRRLRAMERDGQLVFTRRQCYALPERLDLLKGPLLVTAMAMASCALKAVKMTCICRPSR